MKNCKNIKQKLKLKIIKHWYLEIKNNVMDNVRDKEINFDKIIKNVFYWIKEDRGIKIPF